MGSKSCRLCARVAGNHVNHVNHVKNKPGHICASAFHKTRCLRAGTPALPTLCSPFHCFRSLLFLASSANRDSQLKVGDRVDVGNDAVAKAHDSFVEIKPDFTGGAIAMLSDVDDGQTHVVGLRVARHLAGAMQ